MDPDFSDLEPHLPQGTLAWGVFCVDEDSVVGESDLMQADADVAAATHAAETGHAADATPVFVGQGESAGAGDMLSVACCITYDGRPWHTVIVAAPSPEAGLLTLQQLIDLLNQVAAERGFEPRFAAALGTCATT